MRNRHIIKHIGDYKIWHVCLEHGLQIIDIKEGYYPNEKIICEECKLGIDSKYDFILSGYDSNLKLFIKEKYRSLLIRHFIDKKFNSKPINIGYFASFLFKECTYCGDKMFSSKVFNGKIIKSNGIDRIDSKRGYTYDNCQPCCKICNSMKITLSEEVFLSQIEKILNYKLNK